MGQTADGAVTANTYVRAAAEAPHWRLSLVCGNPAGYLELSQTDTGNPLQIIFV